MPGFISARNITFTRIIFLVFDVETIFLLPFAVSFTGLPVGAFVAMIIFLVLLVEGLVWAWRKGFLTWK